MQKNLPSFLPNLPSLDDPVNVVVSGCQYGVPMPFQTAPGDLAFMLNNNYSRHADSNYTLNKILFATGAAKDKRGEFVRNPKDLHALLVKRTCGSNRRHWCTYNYSVDIRKSLRKTPRMKKLIEKNPQIIQHNKYLKKVLNDPKELAELNIWKAFGIDCKNNKEHRHIFGYYNGLISNLQIIHIFENGENWTNLRKLFEKFLKRKLWNMGKKFCF